MSSYSPPDSDGDDDHDFNPGTRTGEVIEERGGLGWVALQLDRSNYGLLLAVVLGMSLPAGLLTAALLHLFFPEYQDVAAELVRPVIWLVERFVELFD